MVDWSKIEWSKWLPIGAFAALIFGLLGKRWEARSRQKHLEDIVFKELVENFYRLKAATQLFDPSEGVTVEYIDMVKGKVATIRIDAFSYAYDKDRETLLQMQGFTFIKEFYDRVAKFRADFDKNLFKIAEEAPELVAMMDGAKATKLIDAAAFDKWEKHLVKNPFPFLQANIERQKTEGVDPWGFKSPDS
jgi:hypothetical protein